MFLGLLTLLVAISISAIAQLTRNTTTTLGDTPATFVIAVASTNNTDSVQQSITNTAVTSQGTVLASRFVVNKGEARAFTREELEVLQLERDNNGAILLSLIATADTPNAKVAGNITFIEAIRGT